MVAETLPQIDDWYFSVFDMADYTLNETRLRAALIALVGAETEDELRQMEAVIRLSPIPDSDKTAMINAIHALLETANGPEGQG